MMTDPVPNPDQLPRFNKPPVVEVAIGVEFLPIPSLTVVPLVELRPVWSDIYPQIEEQPAILSVPPGTRSPFPGFNVAFGSGKGVPPIRIWLLSKDRSQLLQIQNDRLVLNWRANFGTRYPHYDALEPRFLESWHRFQIAITDRALGELRPITATVTYVNRFILEQDETLFDALSIFNPNAILKDAETSVQLSVSLVAADGTTPIGEQKISAARSQDEGKEVQLRSVTRVGLLDADDHTIEVALRRAHAIAVTSFADVTTAKMHERWERNQ